ncbi:CLUMA_CG020845, isoform A [Clunio marinus]|uniref:CLUMA_CG020845, isoform A n=1 Tax=Clunio marinus TaxID=568069 RepID=A0A1J1J8L5_9DIPT|nr:CLUMA_CG020845, isoform A [Clunio marinus]
MENHYGIGIANRYELFYDQDDVTDFETVITKKKEKKIKEPAQQNQLTSSTNIVQPKSSSEKENKQLKKDTLENGNLQNKPNQGQRRGIKDQQNNINKDNSTTQQKEDKIFFNNRPILNKSGNTENREERNNRRNKEMNGMSDFEKPRNVGGNAVGQRNQNRNRNFEGRKRERDRQSGSDKTGVKAIDKRDGNGKGNWGSVKQDIDDINKPLIDDEQKEGVDEVILEPTAITAVGDELKEMTLDEWKAQRQAQLLQPQYNLRKAGEGEDNAQWDKMKRLDKKYGDDELNRKDDGLSTGKKEDGKKKQVLDIEFHFNDGRRGGLGRRPGTGGKISGGHGNTQNRRPRTNRDSGERKDDLHNAGGENRERRTLRRPRFDNRRGELHGHDAQHAPKVNDERDFPSLG